MTNQHLIFNNEQCEKLYRYLISDEDSELKRARLRELNFYKLAQFFDYLESVYGMGSCLTAFLDSCCIDGNVRFLKETPFLDN